MSDGLVSVVRCAWHEAISIERNNKMYQKCRQSCDGKDDKQMKCEYFYPHIVQVQRESKGMCYDQRDFLGKQEKGE